MSPDRRFFPRFPTDPCRWITRGKRLQRRLFDIIDFLILVLLDRLGLFLLRILHPPILRCNADFLNNSLVRRVGVVGYFESLQCSVAWIIGHGRSA
jgi:hypothetical protein